MGATYIAGFFEAGLDFDSVLHVHMRSNCYPPIHPDFTESFKEAIYAVFDEDYKKKITLPNGNVMSAYGIVSKAYLWEFVNYLQSENESYFEEDELL